jgi:hypothetical protein
MGTLAVGDRQSSATLTSTPAAWNVAASSSRKVRRFFRVRDTPMAPPMAPEEPFSSRMTV